MAQGKQSSIYLPDDIREKMERLAEIDRRSLSNVVTLACMDYIRVHSDDFVPKSRRQRTAHHTQVLRPKSD